MVDGDDINPKITGSVSAMELVGGMALKPVVEKALSPLIGNGNVISGVAKLAGAIGVHKMAKGSIGNAVTIGLGADGAEDLINAVSKGKLGTPTRTESKF